MIDLQTNLRDEYVENICPCYQRYEDTQEHASEHLQHNDNAKVLCLNMEICLVTIKEKKYNCPDYNKLRIRLQ